MRVAEVGATAIVLRHACDKHIEIAECLCAELMDACRYTQTSAQSLFLHVAVLLNHMAVCTAYDVLQHTIMQCTIG